MIIHTHENEYKETEVYIAPITHTQPHKPELAKELPPATKARLGLDHDRSWIITSEVNHFTWKGPDVRRTPEGDFAYGHLPPGLTKAAIEQVRNLARDRELSVVNRDDEELKKRVREMRENRKNWKGTDRDRER